jgi:hypothetical protein
MELTLLRLKLFCVNLNVKLIRTRTILYYSERIFGLIKSFFYQLIWFVASTNSPLCSLQWDIRRQSNSWTFRISAFLGPEVSCICWVVRFLEPSNHWSLGFSRPRRPSTHRSRSVSAPTFSNVRWIIGSLGLILTNAHWTARFLLPKPSVSLAVEAREDPKSPVTITLNPW